MHSRIVFKLDKQNDTFVGFFFTFVIFKSSTKSILNKFLKIEIVMWKKSKTRSLKRWSGMWGLLRKHMESELHVISCNHKSELFCTYSNIKTTKRRPKSNWNIVDIFFTDFITHIYTLMTWLKVACSVYLIREHCKQIWNSYK